MATAESDRLSFKQLTMWRVKDMHEWEYLGGLLISVGDQTVLDSAVLENMVRSDAAYVYAYHIT